jgi:hypothetical protein
MDVTRRGRHLAYVLDCVVVCIVVVVCVCVCVCVCVSVLRFATVNRDTWQHNQPTNTVGSMTAVLRAAGGRVGQWRCPVCHADGGVPLRLGAGALSLLCSISLHPRNPVFMFLSYLYFSLPLYLHPVISTSHSI